MSICEACTVCSWSQLAAGRARGEVKGIRFKDAIRNARVVEQQKMPAHSGDWRGCRKSPW